MIERRQYPRLEAHVLWRPAASHAARRPVRDTSIGGVLVYCDEAMRVGALLDVELGLDPDTTLVLQARVVRVDVLPRGAAAPFDVALEFVNVPNEARRALGERLGEKEPMGPRRQLQPRVDEQQPEQVKDFEGDDPEDRLAQSTTWLPLPCGPTGDGDRGKEDRDEQELLHGSDRNRKYHASSAAQWTVNAGRKLKVLFVTPYLPSPPRFGGQQRLHGLISGLSLRHDVSVLSLVDPAEDHTASLVATEAYCRRVTTVSNRRLPPDGPMKRLAQLRSVLSPRSYEWHIHRERSIDDALRRLLASERYDIVQFEFPHMAAAQPAGASGPPERRPAFVLDEHNIEYDVVRQTAMHGTGGARRAFSEVNWRKLQSEERRAWANLDGCTLTSAKDEGLLLAAAPTTLTAVVPNGVDVDSFRPSAAPRPVASRTLLFFGAIDYYPNTDGVLYFINNVFPLLAARAPRVHFSIVGRRPPARVLALRSSTVEVTGAVEDVRPHIERAAVIVVPLRLGGGTRLKILEAMAMGKAIVSTALGAEGLQVMPERDLLIADTPEAFAAQVARLLDDRELAARLGAAARDLVVAKYGWQASVDRLSSFYARVLQARRAP